MSELWRRIFANSNNAYFGNSSFGYPITGAVAAGLVQTGGIAPGWQLANSFVPAGFNPNYYQNDPVFIDTFNQGMQAIDASWSNHLAIYQNTANAIQTGGLGIGTIPQFSMDQINAMMPPYLGNMIAQNQTNSQNMLNHIFNSFGIA